MQCMQLVLFVVELALLSSAQSKKICDFANTECTTLGAQNAYKSVVSGIQGVIEQGDPLHIKELKAEQPSLKYELTNATLSGMANCEVTQFILNDEKLTYQFDLKCAKLVLNHHYNVEGRVATAEMNAEGVVTITLNDYTIDFKGKYSKFISEEDQKLHFSLKKYEVTFESKGKMELDFQHYTLHSDKAKSDLAKAYLYEHSVDAEKLVRTPLLKSYLAIFMSNFDKYFQMNAADKIFYQH